MNKKLKLAVIATGVIAIASSAAQAAFTGYYAPGNWTTTVTGVNAGNSVVLDPTPPETLFLTVFGNGSLTLSTMWWTIPAQTDGAVKVPWIWSSDPGADPGDFAQFWNDLNGDSVRDAGEIELLANTTLANGQVWEGITGGHRFGFGITTDNTEQGRNTLSLQGAQLPTLDIVPEPSVWLMNGVVVAAIGSLGFLQYRRRQDA